VNPPEELARHRIARAHDALNEAELLIEQRHFTGALNRLYYAAFYVARALLATKTLDSSRHSGVIALFQEHFVKTGLISTDVGPRITACVREAADERLWRFQRADG
jgi:uncharacterized protein